MKIGEVNTLKILRGTEHGFFLGDAEGNDVLLPKKYVPDDAVIGRTIDVFLYKDSEDRLIATTLTPAALRNQFATLRIVQTTSFGAFADWGLEKDLLIPLKEQAERASVDDWVVARVYLDETTDRLVGSTKINKFFENGEEMDIAVGDKVSLLLYENTDVGFKVIINHRYRGMIYHNEIFQTIGWGDTTEGYVKDIRPDFLIDCSLQPVGYLNIEPNAEKIIETLKANDGYLGLHDGSSSYEIQEALQMSKKTFKKAVGQLYKQRQIILEEEGIRLAANP